MDLNILYNTLAINSAAFTFPDTPEHFPVNNVGLQHSRSHIWTWHANELVQTPATHTHLHPSTLPPFLHLSFCAPFQLDAKASVSLWVMANEVTIAQQCSWLRYRHNSKKRIHWELDGEKKNILYLWNSIKSVLGLYIKILDLLFLLFKYFTSDILMISMM